MNEKLLSEIDLIVKTKIYYWDIYTHFKNRFYYDQSKFNLVMSLAREKFLDRR